MTPEEFRQALLPDLLEAWQRECFCASPGFRKLVSFNFEDYGIGPVGLADSQILGLEIIQNRFLKIDNAAATSPAQSRLFECPKCRARCTETYEDYNIWMYRTYFTFVNDGPIAQTGLYLVGYYGFSRSDFEKIADYQPAASAEVFLQQMSLNR
ncbi:MAG: hypothetical protein H6818_00315 [Phycisphaerales bacterium]|nr:hypothetical protein [Phycisphaerales bacterium]MCB9864960.1 hypothetical protein [Phycisphaerales bacterium]